MAHPSAVAATESTDLALRDNFFVGGQVGYNWRLGERIVAGIEVDYTRLDMATLQQARTTEDSLPGRNILQAATLYDLEWQSTVRGRLGYAFDNGPLLYGTTGLAIAQETATRSQFRATSSTTTAFAFSEQARGRRTGWMLGAGAEYVINHSWSIKSEYSYTHFGEQDFAFPLATAGALATPGSSGTVNGRNASNAFDLHTVKAGLNFRF